MLMNEQKTLLFVLSQNYDGEKQQFLKQMLAFTHHNKAQKCSTCIQDGIIHIRKS
jgi:hypothetical protein